ncbi:MAG: thiamine biosynthesis protein [Bacteroidetes bacterium 43-93]|nr:HesA/MoeB/ThiF family protein [Bacteroidota bacterium]OJW97012.1 MAG: thiamine biosynthesis protein [Bacteroidetes bacterium 43-93]
MPDEYTRYSCQIKLPGFGIEKQELLTKASVLIVGIGGLGCPAAQYLASSGIGKLTLVDGDVVSKSNLHRQILFNESEIGEKKALVAQRKLSEQSPHIQIETLDIPVNPENIVELVSRHDLTLDCTDNFDTKYLLNDACVLAAKPLVYGAIYQYEGQVGIFNAANDNGSRSANYRDIFPDVDSSQIPDCNDGGVIPTLAGMIGLMQANEAIKYITDIGQTLVGKLAILDALTMQTRVIKLPNETKTQINSLPVIRLVATVNKAQLNEFLENGDSLLLDVRPAEEHAAFNIGGINIPLQSLTGDIIIPEHVKTIIAYCATGKRSGEAVKVLNRKLQDIKVYSLEKGLQNWD